MVLKLLNGLQCCNRAGIMKYAFDLETSNTTTCIEDHAYTIGMHVFHSVHESSTPIQLQVAGSFLNLSILLGWATHPDMSKSLVSCLFNLDSSGSFSNTISSTITKNATSG